MIRGDIEALGAANCAGIAANIDQSFSISSALSIRGRATLSIMLTLCSYKTDLTLVILSPKAEMLLRFNFAAAHTLSRPPIQLSPFACKTDLCASHNSCMPPPLRPHVSNTIPGLVLTWASPLTDKADPLRVEVTTRSSSRPLKVIRRRQ